MSGIAVIVVTIALFLCALIWVRSKYTFVHLRITSPIVRPAKLNGTVVNRLGPVKGAIVKLIPGPENTNKDIPSIKTTTETDGFFSFRNVFPASYQVLATAPGETPAEATVTLSEGDQKQVRLELQDNRQ